MNRAIATSSALLLALLASGSAFAAKSAEAVPYQYGMPLDVARVISIDEPNPLTCETVQAKMTYVDAQGERKSVTYLKQSSACANS
ncbi:DUF2790 domain-containing protein [Metapseudomonas furukawaii]|jgi:hypothetical protein|uniref:Type IIA topoisomerase (DNA gyrase/topo II, topoisomerase IV), A subunit n=1 Tax=Metapseudomonas furukawaii TaxID=1149133 RepID=A0AAD1BW50_METFU|nr:MULTISPECIES: DUF2790 domain-containing protein [Pseudomonas]ELS27390.1 hypothetical protein ppKF707_2794 [Pseudomonas furukawaii]OWJ98113.1 topoisomerase II [Pseudomonas sp. A46]BAU72135.1 hypothetical protein KF707C_4470 [Pseudomonas furukawaii]